MSAQQRKDQERPCLHCSIVDLLDQFYTEYPASNDEPDVLDTDEAVDAIAKVIAEMTSAQDSAGRQQIIETLMRQIMSYDKEFREEDAVAGPTGSLARH